MKEEFQLSHVEEAIILETERLYPKPIESIEDTYKRVKEFKQYLKDFINNSPNNHEGKIGVVGHGAYFRIYTTKEEFWTSQEF